MNNRMNNITKIACLAGAAIALGIVSSETPAQTTYTYHELKIPAQYPGASAEVRGVSPNSNHAVGWIQTGLPSVGTIAAIWDLDAPDDDPFILPTTPFQSQSQASSPDVRGFSINDAGHVLGSGTGVHFGGGSGPFVWSPTSGYKALPTSSGGLFSGSHQLGPINSAGHAVANAWVQSGTLGAAGAVHWTPPYNNVYPHFPPDGFGFPLSLYGLNDFSHVVGSYLAANPFIHGSGAPLTGYNWLGPTGISEGYARDLNNCDFPWEIVGYVRFGAGAPAQAVLWEWNPTPQPTNITYLPGLSSNPDHSSTAWAINDASQILGNSQVSASEGRQVLWERHPVTGDWTVTDLSSLLEALVPLPQDPTWSLDEMQFMPIGNVLNNNGYLVGQAKISGPSGSPFIRYPFVFKPDQSPALTCQPATPVTFALLPPVGVPAGRFHLLTLTAVNATPGATVYFVDDTSGDYQFLLGMMQPLCPPPLSQWVIGSAVADGNGEAVLTARIRNPGPGQTIDILAIDMATCEYDVQPY